MTGVAHRLFRQSLAYAGGGLAAPIIGILMLPLYTRFLSPAEFGIIGLLDVVAMLLGTVFSLGVLAMVPFYYADETDAALRRRKLGTLLLAVTAINTVLAVIVAVAGDAMVGLLFPSLPTRPFVWLLIVTAFVEPYWTAAGAVLQIKERASRYTVLATLRMVVVSALRIVSVAVLGLGVVGFIAAGAATAFVWLLPAALVLRREVALAFMPGELWRALRVGGPTVPNNLLSYGFRAADRVVLERFATRDEIGLYYMALRIADVARLASDVFVSAWRPIFLKEGGRPGFAESVVPVVIRGSAVAFIGLFVAGALFAPEMVAVLMAAEYSGAAVFLPPLLAAMALKGMYSTPYLMIWFRKKTSVLPLLSAVTLVFGLTATFMLTSWWGAWGAAVAYALSWTVLFALTLGVGRRLYRAPYPWREVATASVLAAIVVGIALFVEPGLGGTAAKLVLFAGFAGGIVATGCVRVGELRSALAPARAVWSRRAPTVVAP
jgi:O-antigen/teichoic acid export membrane protein